MDRYKFRGKLKAIGQEGDGDWVYGHYCKILATHFIIPDCADYEHMDEDVFEVQGLCEVDGDTVGQYTGLKDKNGVDLDWWEGDKFTRPDYLPETFCIIIYKDGCFWMWSDKYKHRSLLYEAATWGIYTKIGTIHDKEQQ